jgi:hypothetical protein
VLELEHEAGATALLAERTLLEFTYPEVGKTVAERWNLLGRYVAAIAHHHDPGAAGDEARFCALIGLADQAAHALSAAGTLAPAREPEQAARLADLGLGPADWGDCLQHLHEAEAGIEGFARAIRSRYLRSASGPRRLGIGPNVAWAGGAQNPDAGTRSPAPSAPALSEPLSAIQRSSNDCSLGTVSCSRRRPRIGVRNPGVRQAHDASMDCQSCLGWLASSQAPDSPRVSCSRVASPVRHRCSWHLAPI